MPCVLRAVCPVRRAAPVCVRPACRVSRAQCGALRLRAPESAFSAPLLALEPVHFRPCCLGTSVKTASGTHHQYCALACPQQVLQDGAWDLGALERVSGQRPAARPAVPAVYVCRAAKHRGVADWGTVLCAASGFGNLCGAATPVLQRRQLRPRTCSLSPVARPVSGSSPSPWRKASGRCTMCDHLPGSTRGTHDAPFTRWGPHGARAAACGLGGSVCPLPHLCGGPQSPICVAPPPARSLEGQGSRAGGPRVSSSRSRGFPAALALGQALATAVRLRGRRGLCGGVWRNRRGPGRRYVVGAFESLLCWSSGTQLLTRIFFFF